MLAHITTLALLSVGAAAADIVHSYGFELVVELSTERDLPDPVAGTTLNAISFADGETRITASHSSRVPTIFFINGTADDASTFTTNWASLGPQRNGLTVKDAEGEGPAVVMAYLNAGDAGERDITFPASDGPPHLWAHGNWLFCDTPLAYSPGSRMNFLEVVTSPHVPAPSNCVKVQLVPYCAPLPRGTEEKTKNAVAVRCYL